MTDRGYDLWLRARRTFLQAHLYFELELPFIIGVRRFTCMRIGNCIGTIDNTAEFAFTGVGLVNANAS